MKTKNDIEVVKLAGRKEDMDFLNKKMKENGATKKLLNPINLIKIQNMIRKFPIKDKQMCIQDSKNLTYDKLSPEAKEMYMTTMKKIYKIK
jgi:hypothetical protein